MHSHNNIYDESAHRSSGGRDSGEDFTFQNNFHVVVVFCRWCSFFCLEGNDSKIYFFIRRINSGLMMKREGAARIPSLMTTSLLHLLVYNEILSRILFNGRERERK